MKLNLLVHKVATTVEYVNETIKNICETYNREKQYPITIVLEFFLVYTLRKLLSYLSDAPRYISNTIMKRELQIQRSNKKHGDTVQTVENDSTLTPAT